jgi:hypothetical protein
MEMDQTPGASEARFLGWVLLLMGLAAGIFGILAHSVLLMLAMTAIALLSLLLHRHRLDVRQALIRGALRYPILWILWWLFLPGRPLHELVWG